MHERVAVYCATRNLYDDMITAAKSLLYHNGADHVWFLTEDDVFPEPLPDCISTINVSNQTFFRPDGPNFQQHWTYMVLMRAALSKVFPQYDRILSLDCDTIVNKDISGIWNTNLSGKYYAGVRELLPGYESRQPYCNFGVILFNLAQLRDGTEDLVIRLLNEKHFDFNEQEAFRDVVRDNYVTLPPEYNAIWYNFDNAPINHARIIHYANHPRSQNVMLFRKYARKSWNEIMERRKLL